MQTNKLLSVGVLISLLQAAPASAEPKSTPIDEANLPNSSAAVASLTRPAATEKCGEANVAATAATADERRLACSAATKAVQLLGRCGISLRRPLHVHIVVEARHPLNRAVFGLFDAKQDKAVVGQEASISSLARDTPYSGLPLRDLQESLIVHEVVHGIMHQNLRWRPTSYAAHEYSAYALQIESLPLDTRKAFLQSVPNRASAGDLLFNDPVLFADPFFFAASAYEHFKASGDGCTHFNALLQGEVAFILALPWEAPQPAHLGN